VSEAPHNQGAPGPSSNAPVLVCFAVKEEAKFFKAPPGIRATVTGMGRSNATAAIEKIFTTSTPGLVLTCGFAGGLNPRLKCDDVVYDADAELKADERWQKAGARPVNFFCARRVAITVEEKQRLWRSTGLDAVEMESQAIREFCREKNVPSATIRVISDSAHEDLPLDFNTLLTPAQKIDYTKLGWALVRSPMKLGQLLAFQQKTVSAARSLAQFLHAILPPK
jgi:adenosylhomocysteine nucleosidase